VAGLEADVHPRRPRWLSSRYSDAVLRAPVNPSRMRTRLCARRPVPRGGFRRSAAGGHRYARRSRRPGTRPGAKQRRRAEIAPDTGDVLEELLRRLHPVALVVEVAERAGVEGAAFCGLHDEGEVLIGRQIPTCPNTRPKRSASARAAAASNRDARASSARASCATTWSTALVHRHEAPFMHSRVVRANTAADSTMRRRRRRRAMSVPAPARRGAFRSPARSAHGARSPHRRTRCRVARRVPRHHAGAVGADRD